jgi:hypothetical protein
VIAKAVPRITPAAKAIEKPNTVKKTKPTMMSKITMITRKTRNGVVRRNQRPDHSIFDPATTSSKESLWRKDLPAPPARESQKL